MDNTTFIEKLKSAEYAGFNAIEYADGGQELYLSFKGLLEWTNTNLNMYSKNAEIIQIDFESDKPMFMYSTTVSTNLQKCYIRNSLLNTTGGTLEGTEDNTLPSPFNAVDKFDNGKLRALASELSAGIVDPDSSGSTIKMSPTLGNINNIYLNCSYISEQLIKHSDNEGNMVSIANFLQELCNGVNKALGSINDLQVVGDVDGKQDILTITDYQQVRIKGLVKAASSDKRETSTINAQGLKSMVTSISAQSSITPDLATMISVGAQANGEALGQEAVAFQKLNNGLEDRVYPTKGISRKVVEIQNKAKDKRKEEAESKFRDNLVSYVKLITNQQPISNELFSPVTLKSDEKTNLENIPVELYKYLLGQYTQTNQTPAGFIPIKLDLTLYGISGIKIFQKFKITKDVLPFSYDQEYDFTVTGVSHTVDSARWSTSISSIMGLAEKDTIEEEAFNLTLDLTLTEGGTGGTGVFGTTGKNCPAPGTNIISNGWDAIPKPFERTILTYQEAKAAILAATDNKNLQIAILAVIIQEQGRGGKISGFNHNYGGFDITRGGWKFTTIGASNTNGYVLATEGGTKCRIAYVSFRNAASFFKVKLASFTRKGFDKPLTGAQVATMWYTKWNGKGARLFWNNNDLGYKDKYPTVEEYDKFVVANFEKEYYNTAKKLIG
tara:strand:+ start:357 stop:2360 length:2004 start_codon:yes stop_codon:yes gene_type:complete